MHEELLDWRLYNYSTTAPALKSIRTISKCPSHAAQTNGVKWLSSWMFGDAPEDADLLDDLGVGKRSDVANFHCVGDGGQHPAHGLPLRKTLRRRLHRPAAVAISPARSSRNRSGFSP